MAHLSCLPQQLSVNHIGYFSRKVEVLPTTKLLLVGIGNTYQTLQSKMIWDTATNPLVLFGITFAPRAFIIYRDQHYRCLAHVASRRCNTKTGWYLYDDLLQSNKNGLVSCIESSNYRSKPAKFNINIDDVEIIVYVRCHRHSQIEIGHENTNI